jgi:hypothetical protein
MASIKNKISYNSPVILSFVIICAVIYLLDVITNTAVSNFLALRKALSFQLVTYILVNFWILCSVPLFCMSIFVPVQHYLDYLFFSKF